MRISNKIKRNISFTLLIVGCLCIISDAFDVACNPSSGKAWFELVGITILTYFCFDDFLIYRGKLKNGILFGNQ